MRMRIKSEAAYKRAHRWGNSHLGVSTMDTPSASSALCNILLVVVLLSRSALTLPALQAATSHTTHLQRVDSGGISAPLGSDFQHRESGGPSHFYRFTSFGKPLFLNLTKSPEWMSGDILVEVVQGNGSSTLQAPQAESSCHFTGLVHDAREEGTHEESPLLGEIVPESWVAVSGCNEQLSGVIAVGNDYYFLEPGHGTASVSEGSAHTISKTTQRAPGQQSCSTHNTSRNRDRSRRSGRGSSSLKRRRRLATSLEYFLEVAVVTEPTMLRTHHYQDLEAYVFTLMNIVSHLYRDASLGYLMRIALLRVIILDSNQTNILSGNSVEHPLVQFCNWMSTYDTSRGLQEDVAVLLTKQSMCDSATDECNVLGMADIGSACMQGYRCNIVKEHGLSTAFSMAHELGHTLNMDHDGKPSACSTDERYIMASSFTDSSNPHIWSACSRSNLASFLGSVQSDCLLNKPPMSAQLFNASGSVSLPGFEYSATEQCQLKMGENATSCSSTKNQCSQLWCRAQTHSTCINFVAPPAPGTECSLPHGGAGMGICYKGSCVRYTDVATPVEGGWSQWSEWTNCSLPCGTGLQFRSRSCDSPVPRFGGHYCTGRRKEFRMCNKEACTGGHTQRQLHCETHPPMAGQMNWTAVSLEHASSLGLDVCKSHCYPGDSSSGDIYTSALASLPDGTSCLTTHSKGLCLAGECEPVGCNGMLWAESSTDECGVWCGNGSSCLRVAGSFSNVTSTKAYHYYIALRIPTGSTHIHISETTPSLANYIAVRGAESDVFINGDFRVLYSGLTNFTLAGSAWAYKRKDGNGAEVVRTSGPVTEDILVYVLATRQYPGITYTFNLLKDKMNSLTSPVYFWKSSEWRMCDAVCGRGQQERKVTCSRLRPGGAVEAAGRTEDLCVLDKPAVIRECRMDECVYSWAVSDWGQCNASCDGLGVRTRTVTCQKMTMDGRLVGAVAKHYCGGDGPPSASQTCSGEACVYQWEVGSWGSCDATTCGEGWKERAVSCVHITGEGRTEVEPHLCREATPLTKEKCHSPNGNCTDYLWQTSEWSECQGECNGMGTQIRSNTCMHRNGTQVLPKFCSWKKPPTPTQRTCVSVCTTATPTSPACRADAYPSSYCFAITLFQYCATHGHNCCKSCGLAY